MEKNISKDEVKIIDKYKGKISFEKCFIPEKDEGLRRLGVEICAVTNVSEGSVKNRIIFRRGGEVSDIECIHTAVCQLTPNPNSETGFEAISIEGHPELREYLSPEDQYFSIKSFTQALVERGIQNTLIEGLSRQVETGQEPLDMNHMMRQQLIKALVKIAPEESKEISLYALDYISGNNPERFSLFSSDFTEIICKHYNNEDIKKLNEINGGIKELPSNLRSCILDVPDLDLEFFSEYIYSPDDRIRNRVARQKNLPMENILEYLEDKDDNVRIATALREDLPVNIIRSLVNSGDEVIRPVIVKHPKLPLDMIRKLVDEGSPLILLSLSRRDDLPPEIVEKFARSDDQIIQRNIWNKVKDGKLPVEVIEYLLNTKDNIITREIAQFKWTSRNIMEKLVHNEDEMTRAYIAWREELPRSLIKLLSKDASRNVRLQIANRDDLSQDIIGQLSMDEDLFVVRAIGEAMETPLEIIENIIDRVGDSWVVKDIISGRELPYNIIKHLIDVRNVHALRVIAEDESTSDDIIRELVDIPDVRISISDRQSIPRDVLLKLVDDNDSLIRLTIAYSENLKLGKDILGKLARDQDNRVRRGVASRSALPINLIRLLSDDEDGGVKYHLIKNQELPYDIIEKFANDKNDIVRYQVVNLDSFPVFLYELIASDETFPLIREAIAKKPDLPEKLIRSLADDESAVVRSAIAKKEKLPRDIVTKLKDDPSPIVREAIRDR